MKFIKDYELVCGIEIHAELLCDTKIFCSCKTTFGAQPNTLCCPVCTGMPGAMPTLNRRAVELAAVAGLALGCEIAEISSLDRKNYFYPDLPKAYQISQLDRPLCKGGGLDIETKSGKKHIGITRIHIEEDAGKLIHDTTDEDGRPITLIDCNRCGVPLIEIVTEPDFRSDEEAVAFLKELRRILLFAGVSDCKMNEGSLRADINLSVRKRGEREFGTRTEIKNLNSFAFVAKAIESEYNRQVELLESGRRVEMQTRRFDPSSGKTFLLRTKETADDYRFFPEPDIPTIHVPRELIERLRSEMPKLPKERRREYLSLGLPARDAEQLIEQRSVADYFERAVALTEYPKLLANLMLGELFSLLPSGADEPSIPIPEASLARLAQLSGEEVINSSTAKRLVRMLYENKELREFTPDELVERFDLARLRDPERIRPYVLEALAADPKAVETYKSGKKSALGAIMGRIMSATDGRADPAVTSQLLAEELVKINP